MKLLLLFTLFFYCAFAQLDREWWKHTSIYQIVPATFKDSNNDGIGDIQGIISQLDHFADLEIETLLLSLDYTPPNSDVFVSGHPKDAQRINPTYGTSEDFTELINELQKRGMKLILDIEINHLSIFHEWFVKSANVIEPYTNYFIWEDPKYYFNIPYPPNNWKNVNGDSAWKFNGVRRQFYLHQFLTIQPDLNLRHPDVKKSIKETLANWMDLGVSGFKLSSCRYYIEDEYFRNNKCHRTDKSMDQPETYDFISELREFIDQYNEEHYYEYDEEKILLTEARIRDPRDMEITWQYFSTNTTSMAHIPINYYLASSPTYSTEFVEYCLNTWLEYAPKGNTPNWLSEDHVYGRLENAVSKEYADLMTMLIMTLPGVAIYYYGQEIGMGNGWLTREQNKDGLSEKIDRKMFRLPMQWDETKHGGFSGKKRTYLPVKADYYDVNVKKQMKSGVKSRYNAFKTLSKLRKNDVFKYSDAKVYTLENSDGSWGKRVLVVDRSSESGISYIVVLNLGSVTETVNLTENIENLPSISAVVATTVNSNYDVGDAISNSEIKLTPLSGFVLLVTKDAGDTSEELPVHKI